MKLCDAIAARRLIRFHYDGHPRVVQPAAYGRHRKGEHGLKLRGYQVAGSTTEGTLPDWRLFSVERIQGLQVLPETFADAPPGYRRGDAHLHVLCEL